jgi:hypothetical protein
LVSISDIRTKCVEMEFQERNNNCQYLTDDYFRVGRVHCFKEYEENSSAPVLEFQISPLPEN